MLASFGLPTIKSLATALLVTDVKDYASVFERTQNIASVREGAAV